MILRAIFLLTASFFGHDPQTCPECARRFRGWDTYARHRREVHGIEAAS
jgi:uncharacterized C2H2 Zn-finger protein